MPLDTLPIYLLNYTHSFQLWRTLTGQAIKVSNFPFSASGNLINTLPSLLSIEDSTKDTNSCKLWTWLSVSFFHTKHIVLSLQDEWILFPSKWKETEESEAKRSALTTSCGLEIPSIVLTFLRYYGGFMTSNSSLWYYVVLKIHKKAEIKWMDVD